MLLMRVIDGILRFVWFLTQGCVGGWGSGPQQTIGGFMNWNKVAKVKLKPKRSVLFELRDMDKKIVCKGDFEFVVGRMLELGGVIGRTHFILPSGWDVSKVYSDIKACSIGGV